MNSNLAIEAEYADIILALLQKPFNINSITKLVFMSFCVHNENRINIYNNRKKDLIDLFISNINIRLESHTNEISIIFELLNKLNKSKWIIIDKDYIVLKKEVVRNVENEFLKYCIRKKPNPIEEVNKLDAKAFMEEVLRYV